MAAKNKVCEYCGEWFTPHKNVGKRQRFCCEECSRAWWLENRKEAGKQYTYICQNCGKEYQTTYADRNTCCSRECGYQWKGKQAHLNSLVEKQCLSCGRTFQEPESHAGYCSDKCKERGAKLVCAVCGDVFYGNRNAKYCSDECSRKFIRDELRKHRKDIGRNSGRIETFICKECGKEFSRKIHNRVPEFCSKKCARKNWRANNPDKVKAMKSDEQRRRRARKYGNGPVEAIDFNVVCERDGWRCGICGEKVNPNLKHPHPMSATLDHIIPLAQGGTHTWGNVQLAHFICNSYKGAEGGGQLRLGITINVE